MRIIGRGKCPATGHKVRLIAPHYVKPFIKRQKNDAADAESDRRGGAATDHAVCGTQDPGTASPSGCVPDARKTAR